MEQMHPALVEGVAVEEVLEQPLDLGDAGGAAHQDAVLNLGLPSWHPKIRTSQSPTIRRVTESGIAGAG